MVKVKCYKCGKEGEIPEDINPTKYITVRAWGFIISRMETNKKVWVCESCFEAAT